MSDFSELLAKRRAIREYQDKEVPLNLTMEILKDACLAPSAGNQQPWRFIVINNRDLIRRLSTESKKNLLDLIRKNPESPMAKYETVFRNDDFNVFYNAPCLIFIVASKEVDSYRADCSLAAAYIMFSAANRGLGTCWVELGASIKDPGMLDEIGLPDGFAIAAPLILGYPRTIPASPERKPPQTLKIIS